MTDQDALSDYPELIIGISGPIGVDVDLITEVIAEHLSTVGYASAPIRLTQEMCYYDVSDPDALADIAQFDRPDTFDSYMRKMSYANGLRKQYDAAVLARIAIDAIRATRKTMTGSDTTGKPKFAYIVRQLKRPEEVTLLRQVYGPQFVLASAYASKEERKSRLSERLRRELSTFSTQSDVEHKAERLIERDASETENDRGQALRETFHLGDIFIDGINYRPMSSMLQRFVFALFGKNDISPSKDEYGMYSAQSASLRSADLSRQVGAAIFSDDGELITQGCNEAPKVFGGYYWDQEEPDNRDIKRGHDPNDQQKLEVLRDAIERLRIKNFLSDNLLKFGLDSNIVEHLVAKRRFPEESGALESSKLMDLTEFSRVVHAEMAAICDAARLGRSTKGATLYCTTFPCHNCAKHIIASGITRVVYMEPYIKSRAKDLHPDEIEIEKESRVKVSFVPFMGVSPHRYRAIFQKRRRKDDDGRAQTWYKNIKRPMVDVVLPSYFKSEEWALSSLLGTVRMAERS